MILHGEKEHEVLTVGHSKDGKLFAFHELLDEHFTPSIAEDSSLEHYVDRLLCFFDRLCDDNAFPRGKSACFRC